MLFLRRPELTSTNKMSMDFFLVPILLTFCFHLYVSLGHVSHLMDQFCPLYSCFSAFVQLLSKKRILALELALTSVDIGADAVTHLAQTGSPAQCDGNQIDVVDRRTTEAERGGVIFALAESHFENDAAFQDPFI